MFESNIAQHGLGGTKSTVYYGVFLSFWAGMATGIGAILAVGLMDLFRDKDKGVHGVLAFSLALAAGVMITVSVVDLWFPLAVTDGLVAPTFVVFVGMAGFQLISNAMNATKFCQQHHAHQHSLLPLTDRDCEEKMSLTAQQRNLKVAAMMFLALTLHNFPEGTCFASLQDWLDDVYTNKEEITYRPCS
jgi:zinc transporter ZupT